jgi:tetratricopeptide (TPR) repeat protein
LPGRVPVLAAVAALILGVSVVSVAVVLARGGRRSATPAEAISETEKQREEEQQEQNRLEEERRKLAQVKLDEEERARKHLYDAVMAKAEQAAARKQFAQAARLYREALDVASGENAIVAVVAGLEALDAARRDAAKAQAEKRKQDVDRALAAARELSKQREKYLEAIVNLEPDNQEFKRLTADRAKKYNDVIKELEKAEVDWTDPRKEEVRKALSQARDERTAEGMFHFSLVMAHGMARLGIGKARTPKEPQEERAERERAETYLNYAKKLIDQGMTEKAKERLKEVVQKFPRTKPAEEAACLLGGMENKQADDEKK